MDPGRSQACLGDGCDCFFKLRPLRESLWRSSDLGRGEVGEDSIEAEQGLALQPVEQYMEMFAGWDALAGHSGVDLEMNG